MKDMLEVVFGDCLNSLQLGCDKISIIFTRINLHAFST